MNRPTRPIEPPPRAAGEVHLWRIALDAPANAGEISAEERERAARLRFERDWRRFVAAHAALRRILGGYLGVPAAAVEFAYGRHGKPSLAGRAALHFNLSHSEELALLAVTEIGAVGVDVERERTIELEIADRYFAAGEVAALRALPADERQAAFFRCWTRKEAYLKARGEGVLLPLDGFEVSLARDQPRLARVMADAEEAARWQIAHLEPAPGYVAALAMRATGWPWRKLGDWS
ncbi:MAG: 4'-phosphopantetheinyl transferase family protein [Terriglobales bacterium]